MKCTGYDLFVNLVKPNICCFCIRCCKNAASAKYSTRRRSRASCELIILGTYSKERKQVDGKNRPTDSLYVPHRRTLSKDQRELRKTKRDLANKNIQNIYIEILLKDEKNKRTPNRTKKSEDYRRNK
ncbi:hypothetical protein F8M41_007276 [Gigaspora margarita]|uniref:Uncharacterized protein n=1 Tax=Gigaspora margarita TaxID=4874 RepID=A0A8H4A5G2_GIGMA|nr:hypothetical protein F8M41_007276 [Gigaspora margarita]